MKLLSNLAAAVAFAITPMCAHADAAARATDSLSDGQIAKIVKTANDGEIAQGKLAEKNSDSDQIKSFAKMMIDQHQDVNQQLMQVSKAEKIKAQNSSDASSLKKDGDATASRLSSLRGAEFDQAYVAAQVKAHQDVLNTIDNSLLPNAKDAKLQAMLKKVRPSVQMHLEHAKDLQGKLQAASGSGFSNSG